jgi:hypothetical protein
VVFVYTAFHVIIEDFMHIGSQIAAVRSFFHHVSAGAVWAVILTLAFRVVMGKSSALEAPCCGYVIGCLIYIPYYQ